VTLIKDKLPLLGSDEESLFKTLKQVLKNESPTRIDIDARTGMVSFWRQPNEEEKARDDVNPFRDVLRQVAMDEYVPDEEGLSPHKQLFEIFDMLTDAGCIPAFILTGSLEGLRKWITFPRRSSYLGGVPIKQIRELADTAADTLLICGSKVRDAEPIDVEYVVKVTLL
jgi:hypothetical protein